MSVSTNDQNALTTEILWALSWRQTSASLCEI